MFVLVARLGSAGHRRPQLRLVFVRAVLPLPDGLHGRRGLRGGRRDGGRHRRRAVPAQRRHRSRHAAGAARRRRDADADLRPHRARRRRAAPPARRGVARPGTAGGQRAPGRHHRRARARLPGNPRHRDAGPGQQPAPPGSGQPFLARPGIAAGPPPGQRNCCAATCPIPAAWSTSSPPPGSMPSPLPDALQQAASQYVPEPRCWSPANRGPSPPRSGTRCCGWSRAPRPTSSSMHAAATATVTLGFLPDAVTLDIYDDGAGFDPAAASTAVGRRRLRAAGHAPAGGAAGRRILGGKHARRRDHRGRASLPTRRRRSGVTDYRPPGGRPSRGPQRTQGTAGHPAGHRRGGRGRLRRGSAGAGGAALPGRRGDGPGHGRRHGRDRGHQAAAPAQPPAGRPGVHHLRFRRGHRPGRGRRRHGLPAQGRRAGGDLRRRSAVLCRARA